MILLATALLIGLDLYLSYSRMQEYGPLVELNPVAQRLSKDYGTKIGILFLAWWNVGLLAGIEYYHAERILDILFGAKLGLAAMQLKSLSLEHYVNRILKGINKHES